MAKIVFITGATSGFGEACALQFAEAGYNIIINGRREDRLKQLKKDLEEKFSVRVLSLPFDVSKRDAVFSAVNSIPGDWNGIQ